MQVKGKIKIITKAIKLDKFTKQVAILDLKHDNQIKLEFRGKKMMKELSLLNVGDNIQVAYLSRVNSSNDKYYQNNIAMAIRRL